MFTCNFLPEPLKFDVQSALVAQHGCSKQVGCIRPAFKWQMTQMFLIYVSHSGIYSFNRSRRGGMHSIFFSLSLCTVPLAQFLSCICFFMFSYPLPLFLHCSCFNNLSPSASTCRVSFFAIRYRSLNVSAV